MAEITQTLQFPQSKTRLHQQHRLPFSLYVLPHGTFYAVKRTHARTAHRTQCSASVRFVLLARLQERFHHSRSSHQTFFSSGADFLRGEKREKHKSEPWVQEGGPENPGTAPLGHEDPRKGEIPPKKPNPRPHRTALLPPPHRTPQLESRPTARAQALTARRGPEDGAPRRGAVIAGRQRGAVGQGKALAGARDVAARCLSLAAAARHGAGTRAAAAAAAPPPARRFRCKPRPFRRAVRWETEGGGCLRSWAGPKLLRAWPRGRRGPMRGRDVRSVVQ